MLRRLQGDVRSNGEPGPSGSRGGVVPADLQSDTCYWLETNTSISRQIDAVVAALLADVEYEHLGKEADKAVWDFVCRAAIEARRNHVPGFVSAHRREPFTVKIVYGIEHLTVGAPFSVHEVTILPLPDEDSEAGKRLRQDLACGAMAEVEVTGTDMHRMIDRGRERVEYAIQLLRVCLANLNLLSDMQLRFRVGRFYVAAEAGFGFQRHKDAPVELEVPTTFTETFSTFKLLPLAFDDNETEIARQAKLAVAWISEARLATNLIHKVTFLFSALEAMLGSKSEGLKAPSLVYYRSVLGEVVSGGFPNPNRLYGMYDEIRSSAVHGETVVDIAPDDVRSLEWSIRSALFELVQFADDRKLVTRSAVRKALRSSENARRGYEYLKERSPEKWWRDWSPWEKPDKGKRERELAAEIDRLKQEVQRLEHELSQSRRVADPGAAGAPDPVAEP